MRSCQAPLFENLIGGSTPPLPQQKKGGGEVGGCILFNVFVQNDLEYVIKHFLFSFLFRLFSFLVEMCNRNTKRHCAFTRSQSPGPKFHCKLWLGIEILWLVWFINDAIIRFSTRKFVVYLIWNLYYNYIIYLQHYDWKYSVMYAAIFWGYCFQQEVWEQKSSETQKDIIKVFKERLQKSTETYSEFKVKYLRELFLKIVQLKAVF